MPIEPTPRRRIRGQVNPAQAMPLGQAASEPPSNQKQATGQEPMKQTDLVVLLAWALVVLPIIWGFLQTVRYSLLLFQ